MSDEIIFREDMSVELVKSSASDADVIWAARVSTAGDKSLEDVGSDASQFAVVGIMGAGGSAISAIATATLLGFRNALYGIQMAPILKLFLCMKL